MNPKIQCKKTICFIIMWITPWNETNCILLCERNALYQKYDYNGIYDDSFRNHIFILSTQQTDNVSFSNKVQFALHYHYSNCRYLLCGNFVFCKKVIDTKLPHVTLREHYNANF